MKILTLASAGKLDFYLEDIAFFLGKGGAESEFHSLNDLNKINLFNFIFSRESRRLFALKTLLSARKPDLLMLNSSRVSFDFRKIREFFQGKIVVFDMEGPNFKGFSNVSWIPFVDLVVTVSRYSAAALSKHFPNVVYLPHGVNPERFHRVSFSEKFHVPAVFVGRPSPHRNEYLSEISGNGLRLYGKKWLDPSLCVPEKLRKCCLERADVHGENLLKAISGADVFVNILQDQFKDLKTLMNLQTFMVPACGTCLLTEYVEELPDAFEPGKEVAVFHSAEEFREMAKKYMFDRVLAGKTAAAGYRRCLADHTLAMRAEKLLELFRQL